MTDHSEHTSRRWAAVAETAATLAMALWLGGMVALGALAAPTVFGQLEREAAGAVMGTIFAKFDRMVLVLAAVFAAAEVARAALERGRGVLGRVRLGLAAVLVLVALVSSLWIGPAINELFAAGARRGMGGAGAELDRLHGWAETLGKVAVLCAAAWIGLGVFTRRRGDVSPSTGSA